MSALVVILLVLAVELLAVLTMSLHARRKRQVRRRPRRVPPRWRDHDDDWRWPR